MESNATKERSKAMRATHSAHNRLSVGTTKDVGNTPESELMTVEEYFDEVWNRYLEKYDWLESYA